MNIEGLKLLYSSAILLPNMPEAYQYDNNGDAKPAVNGVDDVTTSESTEPEENVLVATDIPITLNLKVDKGLVAINQQEEGSSIAFQQKQSEPELPSTTPKPQEVGHMPPNRSLDGRLLNILPREQRLLRAVRNGLSMAELEDLYLHLPPEERRQQVDRDAQHIGELLQLHGFNLSLEILDGQQRYIERERKAKGSILQRKPLLGDPGPKKTVVINRQPETKPKLETQTEPSINDMVLDALEGSSPISPLKTKTIMNRVNLARQKKGLPKIEIVDTQLALKSLMDSGYPVDSVRTNSRHIYYKK